MIAHALTLPGSNWTRRDLLMEYRSLRSLRFMPPTRVASGKTCASCERPIDRDGVCQCTS